MKNKILASLTVLCAALVLVGGFSVTAYAQTPTEETDDSGVIVETEPQPLTPEGNMTLVDDIDGDAAEDKQFIVVKSKGGNYFYIIVDRAAEGENSVHFLNQVDESDLMAIIGEEQTEQPPAVCNCTEKCKAGEVNTACPACSVNMDSCTGKEATPEEPAEQEQPQNGMGGLLIFLVVGLLGGGAALYYVKFIPDEHLTGEQIRTPRGSFYVSDMSVEQMKEAGYGLHHQSDDGKYLIMGNGTRAFAVAAEQPEKANPLKHIEDTIEQNDNNFDGIINNTPQTPTVDALEQKAKAGEVISLVDLAEAIKTDRENGRGKKAAAKEKPSIRAQLKADKERAGKKKPTKQKSQDLERS